MKQHILVFILFFAVLACKAQLANTNWKGTIQSDQPTDVIFNFGKDTMRVLNVGDASVLEILTFSIKDNVITMQKVEGQSNCDNSAGQYKFEIKDNAVKFALITDSCEQRAAVLNKSSWTRVQ